MGDNLRIPPDRHELEARILAAALKQSFERGDVSGALLAHKQLTELLKQRTGETEGTPAQKGPEGAAPFEGELPEGLLQEESAGNNREEPALPADGRSSASGGEPSRTAAELPAEARAQKMSQQPGDDTAPSGEAQSQEMSQQPGDAAAPPGEARAQGIPQQSGDAAELPQLVPSQEQAPAPAAAAEPGSGAGGQGSAGGDEAGAAAAAPASLQERGTVYGTYYDILGVDPVSSFSKIHVHFIRLLRSLLRAQALGNGLAPREFKDRIRTVCVAHDVLRDPAMRTDYDFRLIGLRGAPAGKQVPTPEDGSPVSFANRTPLRIGELLQCAEILEPTELEIAVDMHKAMPEMPFGQFLVRQEFLTNEELDSALLGQRLIVNGNITVAQFQVAMYNMRETGAQLADTLVVRGWATQTQIEEATSQIPVPPSLAAASAGAEAPPQVPPVAPVEAAAPVEATEPRQPAAGEPSTTAQSVAETRQIAASNAVPGWAEQIFWEEHESETGTAAGAASGAEARGSTPLAVQPGEDGPAGATADEAALLEAADETAETLIDTAAALAGAASAPEESAGSATVEALAAGAGESLAETAERLSGLVEAAAGGQPQSLAGAASELSASLETAIESVERVVEAVEETAAAPQAEPGTTGSTDESPAPAPVPQAPSGAAPPRPGDRVHTDVEAVVSVDDRDPVIRALQEQLASLKAERDALRELLNARSEQEDKYPEPVLGSLEDEPGMEPPPAAAPPAEPLSGASERLEEEPLADLDEDV